MYIDKTRPITGKDVNIDGIKAIMSKTDPQGIITHASKSLLKVSGYELDELLGQPHSILRHPAMPRAVFYLMWQALERGEEFYGMTVNRAKNGDHYWVFTRVAPVVRGGKLEGYTSARFVPPPEIIKGYESLYKEIMAAEQAHAREKTDDEAQCLRGVAVLEKFLSRQGARNLTEYVLRQLRM